jgi:protoheme IX farnesyltransferase
VPPPVQTLAAPITTAALAGEQLLLDSDPVRLLNTHAATLGRTSGQWRVAHERAEWNIYLQLAKARLSALVTVTALSGWAMAPSAIGLAHSPVCLVGCVLGTALMSASANTINQLIEVPYDAQMRRTQARPLVTGRVTTLHAAAFAAFAATAGCAVLATACNPLTAALGVTNIVLYAGVYTPLKRTSIACTWAGAVVGAIPPLMGWAAITGWTATNLP